MASKNSAPVNLGATFTFISEYSDFKNVLHATNSANPATLLEGATAPITYTFALAQSGNIYAELTNVTGELVQYGYDANNDNRLTGGEIMLQGTPSDITFEDLLILALTTGKTTFLAQFEDSPNNPDMDYNDFVTSIEIGGVNFKHANSGRGNGPELAVVNGQIVEVDPGNSGGHNNGGDIFAY